MNPKKFNMIINIVIVVGFIYLLTMPIYEDIYYVKLYYVIVVFFGILLLVYQPTDKEKFEKRFYIRWSKTRKKGRLLVTSILALRRFVFSAIVVLSIQFIINGNSPLIIVHKFSPSKHIIPVLIFLVLCCGIGVNDWKRNEERYHNIKRDKV